MKEYTLFALDLIKEAEGFRGSIYLCPAGYPTIGYGRNLKTNPLTEKEEAECFKSSDNLNVSKNVAEKWLLKEVEIIADRLEKEGYLKYLDPLRQAVLIDLVYNLGFAKFLTFKKFLIALSNANYGIASDELVDSKWYVDVGRRGKRNAEIMRYGSKVNDYYKV